MMHAVVIGLCILIYWDAFLLKKHNPLRFRRIFKFPAGVNVFFIITFLFALLLSVKRPNAFPFFVVTVLYPIYLLRRSKFLRSINPSDATPGLLLSDALGVIIVWFFCMIVMGGLTKGGLEVFPQFDSRMGELIFTALFSSATFLVLIFKASRRFSSRGFLSNVALTFASQPFYKLFTLPFVLGLLFAYLSASFIVSRQAQPNTPLNEVLMSTESLNLIYLFVATAILFAPLVEEIIFRGYFFHVISKVRSRRFAIYSIAFIFALLHVNQYWGDWMAIAMVTLLGFVLTYLRAWSGSTVSSTVMHYVYNGGVTLIPILLMFLSNPAYVQFQTHYDQFDPKVKVELLKESIRQNPKFADAYNDLAWMYAEQNTHLDEALKLIEKALSFDPANFSYLDTKAEILFKLKRFNESRHIRDHLVNKGFILDYQSMKIEELRQAQQGVPPQE